jgi:hypothetical protein
MESLPINQIHRKKKIRRNISLLAECLVSSGSGWWERGRELIPREDLSQKKTCPPSLFDNPSFQDMIPANSLHPLPYVRISDDNPIAQDSNLYSTFCHQARDNCSYFSSYILSSFGGLQQTTLRYWCSLEGWTDTLFNNVGFKCSILSYFTSSLLT